MDLKWDNSHFLNSRYLTNCEFKDQIQNSKLPKGGGNWSNPLEATECWDYSTHLLPFLNLALWIPYDVPKIVRSKDVQPRTVPGTQ